MAVKKIKKVYLVRKPIIIRIRKKDGSYAEFRGVRIVKKPKKIVFRRIKKEYLGKDE